MSDELLVLLKGRMVGRIRKHQGEHTLEYEQSWRENRDSYPLSLSLPLARKTHTDPEVGAYLEGLLPDSEVILRNWGRRFGVSHRSPFDLLKHVGEDVAGAAQFLTPDKRGALETDRDEVRWLTEKEVEERLRNLEDDRSAWRSEGDPGYFSLAGSQAKTALFYDGDRWGVPRGRRPTSHIVKPPMNDLRGVLENEHVCLELARSAGIPAARSWIESFGDQPAIVVERYDRVEREGTLERVHQEDLCQALGIPPTEKYENQGGPGAPDIIALLQEHSSQPWEDVRTFIEALTLNWIIVGSDAHAKNYSVLLAQRGEVRLAPLYDVISVLPYDEFYPPRTKLAMRIGGEYRVGYVRPRHWEELAKNSGLDDDDVLETVDQVIESVRESLAAVCDEARRTALNTTVVDQLQEAISSQLEQRQRTLGTGANG